MPTASSRPSDAAILLGLAAGLRTFSAPAALALRTRPLGRTQRLLLALAAVEMIADKLPSMPSRLARRGLSGRLISSSLSGRLVAGRAGARDSAGAALASAVCGNRARRSFTGWFWAVAEDALAIALATLGGARSRR